MVSALYTAETPRTRPSSWPGARGGGRPSMASTEASHIRRLLLREVVWQERNENSSTLTRSIPSKINKMIFVDYGILWANSDLPGILTACRCCCARRFWALLTDGFVGRRQRRWRLSTERTWLFGLISPSCSENKKARICSKLLYVMYKLFLLWCGAKLVILYFFL